MASQMKPCMNLQVPARRQADRNGSQRRDSDASSEASGRNEGRALGMRERGINREAIKVRRGAFFVPDGMVAPLEDTSPQDSPSDSHCKKFKPSQKQVASKAGESNFAKWMRSGGTPTHGNIVMDVAKPGDFYRTDSVMRKEMKAL